MKNSTQKNIQWLSFAIMLVATLNLVFIFGLTVSQVWLQDTMVWNPDKLAWQFFIIAGRFVGFALLYIFCMIFLIRTNKSLKNGIVFPKSNIALIRWAALVTVLTTFVQSNYDDVIHGATCSVLDGKTIFIPLVVLLFAGLYKMAYLAAEDSNLSI